MWVLVSLPVSDDVVYQCAPEKDENHRRYKASPFRYGTKDQCGRDTGKLHLEQHEGDAGNLRRRVGHRLAP